MSADTYREFCHLVRRMAWELQHDYLGESAYRQLHNLMHDCWHDEYHAAMQAWLSSK